MPTRDWKLVMRPYPEEAGLAQGYTLAESAQDACAMVDDPDAPVFEKYPETPRPN